MSPIVAAFLRSAALPAAVATALVFAVGGNKGGLRAKLQAFILALAYGAGAYLLIGRVSFPPTDVSESLSYAGLALAVFVFFAPKDSGRRYALRAFFVLFCGALLLWHIRGTLDSMIHWRNMLAFFCLALGVWSIVERSEARVSLPTLILLPLISATATSFLLLFAASASFSQLVSILCTLLGGLLTLSVLRPARLSVAALLPFLSVFIVFFMIAGHFYLDVNPWWMIYLSWPFAVLWVRGWLPVPKTWWLEAPLLGIVCVIPLGYFLWTVLQASGPLY